MSGASNEVINESIASAALLSRLANHVQLVEERSFTMKKFSAESKAKMRSMMKQLNYATEEYVEVNLGPVEELVTAEVTIDLNVDGIITTISIEAQVESQDNVIMTTDKQETLIVSMSEVGATAINNNGIVNQDNAVLLLNKGEGVVIKESVDVACDYNASILIQVQGSQSTCGCEKVVMRMDTGT